MAELSVCHTPEAQRQEFQNLFMGGDLRKVYSSALGGGLRTSNCRSLCWRLFLCVLQRRDNSDLRDWAEQSDRSRLRYTNLLQKHIVDPRKHMQDHELDLAIHNPLSTSSENPWSKFFQNNELEQVIVQDLKRLFHEFEFFQSPFVQESMKRILFVWAMENPDPSYRQGMHELLAPIILVCYRDAIKSSDKLNSSISVETLISQSKQSHPTGRNNMHEEDGDHSGTINDEQLLKIFFDERFIEHDAYCIFDRLMFGMKEWFHVEKSKKKETKNNAAGGGSNEELRKLQKLGLGRDDVLSPSLSRSTSSSNMDDTSSSPIVRICKHIQNDLLREKDPQLTSHLEKLGIEPQLYGLRWLRLLFVREFHIEDVMVLWDSIFADSTNGDLDHSLIEHISVAMLIFLRASLLEMDYTQCMRRVMKYPPVEDIHLFVEKALQSRKGGTPLVPRPKAVAVSPPPQPSVQPIRQSTRSLSNTLLTSTADPFVDTFGPVPTLFSVLPTPNYSPLSHNRPAAHDANTTTATLDAQTHVVASAHPLSGTQVNHVHTAGNVQQSMPPGVSWQPNQSPRIDDLVRTQLRMAKRMGKILENLQSELFEKQSLQVSDGVLIAIAELKQIKDVLSFQIQDDMPDPEDTEPSSHTAAAAAATTIRGPLE